MKALGWIAVTVLGTFVVAVTLTGLDWLAHHPIERSLVVATAALAGIAVAIFRIGRPA